MDERRPRLLLASHDTTPLPAMEDALVERGIDVHVSGNLVDTAARIASETPDLVVFQPLTGSIAGFEIQHVVSLCSADRGPSLLLVLPRGEGTTGLAALVAQDDAPIADFVIGPLAAEELLLRIDAALRRKLHEERLRRDLRSLEHETITDFKTGLHNDRYFFQRLRQEVERSRRHRLALSLVLIDFDDFKRINDDFDHTFGDYVLGAFARKLKAAIRQIDIPARLGGDEFALLLPSTDLEEATLLATRLGAIIGACRFEKGDQSTSLLLSMGIDATPGDEALEPEALLRRADLALLEAKKRGKGRICLYSEIAPATKLAADAGVRSATAGR